MLSIVNVETKLNFITLFQNFKLSTKYCTVILFEWRKPNPSLANPLINVNSQHSLIYVHFFIKKIKKRSILLQSYIWSNTHFKTKTLFRTTTTSNHKYLQLKIIRIYNESYCCNDFWTSNESTPAISLCFYREKFLAPQNYIITHLVLCLLSFISSPSLFIFFFPIDFKCKCTLFHTLLICFFVSSYIYG